MQRVILPRNHEVIRIAVLARHIGGSGVGADIDAIIIDNIGHRCTQHIGENDPGEQLDPVFRHEPFSDLASVSRLGGIVLNLELDCNTAQFAALLVDCKLQAVANILAQITARARQGRYHTDLDRFRSSACRQPR